MEPTNVLTAQPHPKPEPSKTQPYLSKRRINELEAHTRSLPTEIVADIFLHCTTPFQDYHPGDDNSIPLKLGAVCHAWRNTAWAYPRLWSSITLVASDRTKPLRKISLLPEWLSRSGKLPLSIRLYCNQASGLVCQAIHETLNLYTHRWCEIDFQVPYGSFEYLPSDTILPLLRHCSITLSMDFEDRSHRVRLCHTPQLCSLSLDCGGLYLRSLFFEWHRLTNFEVAGIYVDECVEVLRRTPSLINFAVHRFYDGDDDYPDTSHLIELNSLESIVLNNSSIDSVDLTPLLKSLTTPKARKFKYLGSVEDHSFPVAGFVALLNRSACSLTDLSFVHPLITETDLFTILPLMSSLRSLSFTFHREYQDQPTVTENIWSSLNPSISGSSYLLPQLEYLEYHGPLDFTWEVVLKTIEARYLGSLQGVHSNPCFKSLSFSILGPPFTLNPDIKLSFELWKSAGLHLEIQDVEPSSRPPSPTIRWP